MDRTRNPTPPEREEPEAFTPEAAEFEPAGGILRKPPVPDGGEAPTEGDKG